ncbi:MAG TPA: DUF1553 domain-containing protein [Pirellulales bacterium]|jgi:hypothetical protein
MQPRRPSCLLIIELLALLLAAVAPVCAQQPTKQPTEPPSKPSAEQVTFFEREIRPLLATHCFKCHSESKQQGSLRLDSREAILTGGDLGPAAEPGDPAASRLMEVIGYAADLRMPPTGKLNEREIAVLARWVKEGMAWPTADANSAASPADAGAKAADKGPRPTPWSFLLIADPPPPQAPDDNWSRGPLDRFVFAKLAAADLRPAPAAEKRVLLRRAKFDLLGIPPTPAEIDAFLIDESPDAFARAIDRFLAMPEYGQRWGRHWLDVARYADSNGQDENLAYVNAFRYRDYVVDAFNHDKPYDQFVREQIAGDLLLDSPSSNEPFARLIATGFLTLGPKMLAEDDPVKMEMDIVDEQVDAIGGAFLGLTLGCARCHDHKFDPVSTADYYSVAGILKSTRTMDNFRVVAQWHERPLGTPVEIAVRTEHAAQVAAKKSEVNERTERAKQAVVSTARERLADYLLAGSDLFESPPLTSLAQNDAGPIATNLPSDTIVREAENFDRGNVLIDTTNYGAPKIAAGAGGAPGSPEKDVPIGVILNRGELPNFVEYELQIPRAGPYQLELRYAAAEARPVQILLNGKLRKSSAAVATTGSWFADSQRWSPEGVFQLPVGKVVLRLQRAGGPFPHFDRIALVPQTVEAGSPPRLTRTAEELGAERNLVPAFITQWAELLKAAQKDPQSVWRPWLAYRRGEKISADSFAGPAAETATRLLASGPLAEPNPAGAAEFAARYRTEIAAAEKRARESSDEGQKQASNPTDEALRKIVADKQGPFRQPQNIEEHFSTEDRDAIALLQTQLTELEHSAPAPLPVAMAVEEGKGADLKIHVRGSHLTLGEVSPRGFPKTLAGNAPSISGETSGRLELANWITDPKNPLTSRVMVNRLWRWHFGSGLVRSTDNFGNLGDRPSHPELLDWLATRFIESGWSVKSMHRLIMLSSTYQMSTNYNAAAAEADPDNRLLWRKNRRRLEAEAVRDSLLFVGRNLDTSLGGTLLKSKPREYVTSTASINGTSYATSRRSIYLPVVRSALYEAFQAFDFAEPTTIKGDRESTTIASQALFMMNGDVMNEESARVAARLVADYPEDRTARVQDLYASSLGRTPTAPEIARALSFVDRYATELPSGENAQCQAWQALCRVLLSSNEFLYVE